MGVVVDLIASLGAVELSVVTAIIIIAFFAIVQQPWRSNKASVSRATAEAKLQRPPEDNDVDDITAGEHDEESYARIPYHHVKLSEKEMLARSESFYEQMNARRSVRMFSKQAVALDIIKNLVRVAGKETLARSLLPYSAFIDLISRT
jgi:hypothetical protein